MSPDRPRETAADEPPRLAPKAASGLAPDRWRAISRVVDAALELPVEERAAFVERACAGDAELRSEVERLLVSCERAAGATNFLAEPARVFAEPMVEDLASKSAESDAWAVTALASALTDQFVIEREIGRGATATVHLAHTTQGGRAVAIKVLRAELAESTGADRFLREIRLTSQLRHPHILPVIDAGQAAGQLYFVLPYVDGGTLRERLTREKQLPVQDAITIARSIAEALDHAHQRGLIHRDVKPENILFAGDEVYLADFGIARALERALSESSTSANVVRGTVPYMSPEQASGERHYDGRSDVYSLGCVLYEMLAGVPAFIGPSAEAILAQKVTHPPRDLTVFRPHVPAALSAIVRKALQIAPADRFRTAGDFARELGEVRAEQAASLDTHDAETPALVPASRRRVIAGAVALATLVTAIGLFVQSRRERGLTSTHADTTIIAVLPLEHRGDGPRRLLDDDLLEDALTRWRGITVPDRFLVLETIRRRGPIGSRDNASEVARSVGAGRYIRGSITPQSDAWRAYVTLYDVGGAQALHHASALIPADVTVATAAYRRLVGVLLLRGVTPDTIGVSAERPPRLEALQAIHRAQRALDGWDLATADAEFGAAVAADSMYARANLWQAQVRAWRGLPAKTWSTLAGRAVEHRAELSGRESDLAVALSLLGGSRHSDRATIDGRPQYDEACRVYDKLRAQNERDFAAWYGLGMCHWLDRTVLPDSRSPTGWRFRSSYHTAVTAFTKAFEILPAVHRDYERGAFEGLLRVLLLTRNDLITGFALDDARTVFHARPAWMDDGDTLALIPYVSKRAMSGVPNATPPGFAEAQSQQRARLSRIAAGWSAAYPRSAGAKQAVAVALELRGDPTAIDTLRHARLLATASNDPFRKLQLATAEALLLVKFAVPADLAGLRSARKLIDSLLARDHATPSEAMALAPLAAFAGRCRQAEQLARAAGPPMISDSVEANLEVIVEAEAFLARAALGCGTNPGAMSIRELSAASARGNAEWIDHAVMFRPTLLSAVLDSAVIDRLATDTSHRLLLAARAFTRHDSATVRTVLSGFRSDWRVARGPPTPDMVVPGARMLVSIRDTATAIEWLDRTLTEVRLYDPNTLADPARAAAFVSAMVLRAQLAAARQDVAAALRWGRPALVLWSGADSDLQPVVQQLSRHARLR